MCGTAVGAGGKRGKVAAAAAGTEPGAGAGGGAFARNLPWVVAGGAVVALAAALLLRPSEPDLPVVSVPPMAGGTAAGAANPAAIDLSSMSPREAADRLFNRVMGAASVGDTAQARQFAPMAISAYQMVEGLDLDGRYHLAVLHLVNGQPDEAFQIATDILAEVPTHLFGHFTAAEAERMRGNDEAARQHFQHFLDNYADEMASGRTEYNDHAPVLPEMRTQALQAVGGG